MKEKIFAALVILALVVSFGAFYVAWSSGPSFEVAMRSDVELPQTLLVDSLTSTGAVSVDGSGDANQLVVQGYTTQTNSLIVAEQSDGTDVFTLSNDGAGDFAAGIDASGVVSVDGSSDAVQLNVQGYTTQTSSLIVGEQSDGTDVFTLSNAGAGDFAAGLEYGSDALVPFGFDGATSYEMYFGNAASVTQTVVQSDTHNMETAVDWAICYISDPDEDAGDPFLCVPTISGSDVTMQALQDDGTNATTAATQIYYLIIGR